MGVREISRVIQGEVTAAYISKKLSRSFVKLREDRAKSLF
jgi:hypothetical protein